MNSETCLSCEAIERYLGEEEERVHALRGVSLDVKPGSVHAVVGPSGCGKSSLLYILGLLDLPDAGHVSIESEPVSELSDDELAYKRSKFIGFIFQFHFLMEDFTAQENVMIPMRKLLRGHWQTIRELSSRTNRPAISTRPTPSAPLSYCKTSCNKAGKLCFWRRTTQSSPKPAIGSTR